MKCAPCQVCRLSSLHCLPSGQSWHWNMPSLYCMSDCYQQWKPALGYYSLVIVKPNKRRKSPMVVLCSTAKEEKATSTWLISSFISLLRGASFDIQCICHLSCASYENVYIVQIPERIQHFIHLKAFRDRKLKKKMAQYQGF